METGCCVSVLTKRVATILTSSTSPFRKRSRDLIHFPFQKEVSSKASYRSGFWKGWRVSVGELGGKLATSLGNELCGFPPSCDKNRRPRIEFSGRAKQVAVQCSAQALIRAHQYDRTFADFPYFEQRMGEITQSCRGFPLDCVQ